MGRYQTGYGDARHAALALILFFCTFLCLPLALQAGSGAIIILEVKDTINPPVAAYLTENIDQAVAEGAICVIVRLDTPGGLDTAMRDIIQKELNANIPVIVYVAPKGARAASAGALICLASDVAAMAPGTNIGAAHPVSVGVGGGKEAKEGDTMVEKVTNDAVAYARSIARERGRNEQWAEDAVKKSISTPAAEAVEKKVADLMAGSMDELILKLEGRVVQKNGRSFTLALKDKPRTERPMGLRVKLLSALANPNVAYILMLIGLAGIYFELSSPGAILPGIIGGICLILAFFAFQTLPVNYAGVALILLAVIFFIAEIKVPSFGLLTVGGIISLLLGSLLLFRTPELATQVSWGVILPITLFFAAFFSTCVYLVVKVHRRTPLSGQSAMQGETGTVYTWEPQGSGKVYVHGEYWNAQGPAGLHAGDSVVVERMEGMTLIVSAGAKSEPSQ